MQRDITRLDEAYKDRKLAPWIPILDESSHHIKFKVVWQVVYGVKQHLKKHYPYVILDDEEIKQIHAEGYAVSDWSCHASESWRDIWHVGQISASYPSAPKRFTSLDPTNGSTEEEPGVDSKNNEEKEVEKEADLEEEGKNQRNRPKG